MIRLIFSVFFLAISYEIFPQLILSSDHSSYYDDNIFNNSTNESDFINTLSLGTGYNFESTDNNLQFYYMGDLYYYQKNIYKSFTGHKLGVVNTYLVSEDGNPLNLGVNYSFKINREYFEVFDYNILSAYANYMHDLGSENILQVGYLFNRNRFKNYPSFSHDENKFFMKYIKSFESETSITLGAEYDNKNYINTAYEYSGSQTISQMKYFSQISQSLGEKSGLSVHLLYTKNLNNGTRFVTSNELIFYEEELFTDNYSNDGIETGFSLVHYFLPSLKATVELNYKTRDFLNLPVVDESGYETETLRQDKQYFGTVGFAYELTSIIHGLFVNTSITVIKNSSNDKFYLYNNNIYTFGIGWEM